MHFKTINRVRIHVSIQKTDFKDKNFQISFDIFDIILFFDRDNIKLISTKYWYLRHVYLFHKNS